MLFLEFCSDYSTVNVARTTHTAKTREENIMKTPPKPAASSSPALRRRPLAGCRRRRARSGTGFRPDPPDGGVGHAGARDPYSEGARAGNRDPYSDGARIGARDPYAEGANPGRRDPYSEGANLGRRDSFSEGA